MIHEDILKAVMSVVHGSDTPCDATSRYSVLNRKIREIAIKLISVQEEQYTHLGKSDNQQHIYRWVRTNLKFPSVQGQTYKEWELCKTSERIILDN